MRLSRSFLLARIGEGSLVVSDQRGHRPGWALNQRFEGTEELRNVLAGLKDPVARHRLPKSLKVAVEPPLLQRRTLVGLPPVRQADLSRLVARAPQRYFRQNGHPLVSAARWEDAGEPPTRVARAVALESDLAEAIIDGARRAGLALQDIVPEGGPEALSLLPNEELVRRRRMAWQGTVRLLGVAGLLWLGVGAFVATRFQAEEHRLRAELARLEEPRGALTRARRAFDSASAMLIAVDQAEDARNRLAVRVDQLVRLLPDSVVITGLMVDTGGNAQLSGRARQLPHFVAAMGKDPTLRLRVEGRTGHDTLAGVEWERFTARVVPRGPP